MDDNSFFNVNNTKISEALKVNKKEYLLKCAQCEKKLVKIHTTPDLPGLIEIQCKCPYCDDFSFKKKIEAKYFIEPINVVVTNIIDGIIYAEKIH